LVDVRLTFFIILSLLATQFISAQEQLSRSKDERLFKKGLELVEHANYGAARHVFAEFLDNASNTDARKSEAEYYVAYCALNLGHSDGEKLIDKFIENNPSNPRSATAYYDLANFFYAEKNYTKAIQYYKKVNFQALSLAQQSEGRFKYAYSYFNLKKLDEALEQFDYVKGQNSSFSPAASYYAGFIEYSRAQYTAALADFKRIESNASYAAIVPHLISNVYYKQGKYDELIQYANTLQGKSSSVNNYDEISMLVADAYYYTGDYTMAVSAYERYLSQNASKAESALLFRAGYSNYSLSNNSRAEEYLKACAAKNDSVSYYASYYLGIVYLKQGNKQYAANAFNYALKFTADSPFAEESLFQYAKVTYELGKADVAINELEKFLKDFPKSDHTIEVKELLAQAYVNGNNYNKAIEYIEALPRKSTGIERAYQKATYLKGAEHFNKEEYAEAVIYFDKSMTFPVDQNYLGLSAFWAAEAYSIGRKYEEAVPRYLKVIALGNAVEGDILYKARYGLGYAHYNLKQYEQALFNFNEFVQKAKRSAAYVDGLVRLADCYYVSKKYQEAINHYNRARQLNSPDDDYILFQTAVISGILRKYADARTQFTNLISNYPKSTYRDEAIFQRAQFEIEQGNYQQAADGLSLLIREGVGSPFLPYAYMRRAASYYNLKQYDKTISDYVAVLKQFPTHPSAQQVLLPLQEALSIAGRPGEFENFLTAYKQANPESKNLEVVEFETAKGLYFNQQYDRAVAGFTNFIASYASSARISEAKFYMAESHYRLNDFNKALPLYKELVNDNSFGMAGRVVNRVAEIEFKQGKYANAVVTFHKLEGMATNKKELYNAWSGLMESFYLLAQFDSVDAYANLILQKGNVNAGAQNKASLYLGKSAMARGDFETAKDEFINTLNTARDEYGAEAKYLLAEIFFQSKQYTQCYETLVSLNSDFAAYDAWVGKSYLLMADYFVARKELFQAKETLRSLIENFPLEYVKRLAREKLKAIEDQELKKTKQQAAADSVGNN
jgi:TolA-binding protein